MNTFCSVRKMDFHAFEGGAPDVGEIRPAMVDRLRRNGPQNPGSGTALGPGICRKCRPGFRVMFSFLALAAIRLSAPRCVEF